MSSLHESTQTAFTLFIAGAPAIPLEALSVNSFLLQFGSLTFAHA